MITIGHRGSPVENLENSMNSFYRTIKDGAQRIELDIQLSSDHIPFVIHDASLDRTSAHKGLINSYDGKALDQMSLKNGEPIPRLSKVIEDILPLIELNIELKGKLSGTVEATLNALPPIKERPKRIILSSFNFDFLKTIKTLSPEEETAVLWEDPLDIKKITELMIACETKILHPEAWSVTQELMDWAKEEGWEVYPWVSLKTEAPKEKLWEQLHRLGVDGLCTNYPKELIAFTGGA